LRITGTRRWGPGQSAASVQAELAALGETVAQATGLRSTVTLDAAREPFEVPTDDPLVATLRHGAMRVAGHAPAEIGLPLVGDASLYVNALDIPAVYYGPAYETAHSDDERVSLDQVLHVAQVYALTALAYTAGQVRQSDGSDR
jgi:acetylornithine deacetylase/succinyl-diaminopimelate desuccinylase-like protein